jgi:hypothetical protein
MPAVPAPPLGLWEMAASPAPAVAVEAVSFDIGDRLLLYTDGVVETRSPAGDFYPLAERVAEWARESPEDFVRRLHGDLLAHAGAPLADDAAVLVVQRTAVTYDSRDVGNRRDGSGGDDSDGGEAVDEAVDGGNGDGAERQDGAAGWWRRPGRRR